MITVDRSPTCQQIILEPVIKIYGLGLMTSILYVNVTGERSYFVEICLFNRVLVKSQLSDSETSVGFIQ
jgi:hypothetical protein